MPSLSGQVSFSRLGVTGPTVKLIGTDELDLLGEKTLGLPGSGVGHAAEVEAGWCAGDHVYDERFEPEKLLYAGGAAARFALRLDTNKVPAEIKKALKAQHETALVAESNGGFLSRQDKRELKDLVERALHDERSSGKHRKSKLVPVLWDTERRSLLCAAGANNVIEQLCALWRDTFSLSGGGTLRPESAGAIAGGHYADIGKLREFEDMVPSSFTPPPGGSELPARPEVGWSMASPEPHDFLGNEMLVWLWWVCEKHEGLIEVTDEDGQKLELALAMDKLIELECAWGVTGKTVITSSAEGVAPIRVAEAADALATGKWPRKTGLLLSDGVRQFSFALQADRWLVTGCQVPKPAEEETPATDREAAEFRLDQVRRLDGLLLSLYRSFLDLRVSEKWPGVRDRIKAWIAEGKPTRNRKAIAVDSPVEVAADAAEVVASV